MTSTEFVALPEARHEPVGPALRIIHVAAPAAFGGLERIVHALAAGQRARGHDVGVAAMLVRHVSEPPLLSELRAADVRVHAMMFKARAYLSQLRSLARLVLEFRPDVIHSHGYPPDVLVALLKREGMAPIVSTAHGFTGGDRRTRVYEWMQIRAYRRFDAVVAVSRKIRELLVASGIPDRRVHVVRNVVIPQSPEPPGANARTPLDTSAASYNIGWVGRVSREKGLDVLIEALPMLDDLSLHLTVVGNGPDVSMLQERSRTLRVADRVTWLGVTPNAARVLGAFDALVLSSRTEGTPITLLEAMQARVPVVATAVGGIPDVISEREAALVPSERPDLLARAIRETLMDRPATAERVESARKRLDSEFAVPPWLNAYERIYRSVQGARDHEVP